MRFFVLLLGLLLVMAPCSAYTFLDHYTADTSGNYGGDITWFTWNVAGTGTLDSIHDGASNHQVQYKIEKLNTGTYIWNISATDANTPYIMGIWASQSATDTGHPLLTGNKYVWRIISTSNRLDIYKVVGGALTSIAGPIAIVSTTQYNVSVEWDMDIGDIHTYIDGVLKSDINDGTFSAPGYMGVGYYDDSHHDTSWDWLKYYNTTGEGAPTPTPTVTPTWLPPSVIIPENFTCKQGETWLRCNWTLTDNMTAFVTDDQTIFRNGTLYRDNYSHTYISLDDLNSNSFEIIEVWMKNFTYNNYTQKHYIQLRTDPAMVWWYLIIGVGLLILGYFVPLFGLLSIVMFLLGFGMVYQEYNQSYIVLVYGLGAVLSMIITAIRFTGGGK